VVKGFRRNQQQASLYLASESRSFSKHPVPPIPLLRAHQRHPQQPAQLNQTDSQKHLGSSTQIQIRYRQNAVLNSISSIRSHTTLQPVHKPDHHY